MKAVVLTGAGGYDVLRVQERPDPPVGPGEVRIAVRAAGINFADTMARVGLYPDAPKPPCVLGYEVAGEVESVGEGVSRARGRRPRRRRHPLRRPGRAGHGRRLAGLAAARGAELRAGSGLPGQLRHRLRGAGRDGRAARGRPGADPRRRGRRRHLGDADRAQRRRRDLRHRLGLQARGDRSSGRSPPDRLPHARLRAGGDADHRRRGSRPGDRRARPDLVPQGLPAAASGRAPGDVRDLGELARGPARHRRDAEGPRGDADGDDALVEEPDDDEREQGRLRPQHAQVVGRRGRLRPPRRAADGRPGKRAACSPSSPRPFPSSGPATRTDSSPNAAT